MSAPRRGALLVAAAAVCWSSGGLIVRLVTTDAWTTNFWRGLFCAVFLAIVLRITRRQSIVAQWRAMGWPGLGFALSVSVASTCFILALERTSVANTLILMSVGPYVAGLLGWLVLGERVALRTWIAMGVALCGSIVMVSGSWGTGALVGDVLALVMASVFAGGTVLVRRHPGIQMAPAAVLATTMTAVAALPLAEPLATSARDVGLLAIFGVGQFASGFLLFTAGARLIPAAQTSLIGMLETVLGPFWTWLVIGEQPTGASLLGGALVLSALLAHAVMDAVAPSAARSPVSGRGD